jgi:hypothetical protein
MLLVCKLSTASSITGKVNEVISVGRIPLGSRDLEKSKHHGDLPRLNILIKEYAPQLGNRSKAVLWGSVGGVAIPENSISGII